MTVEILPECVCAQGHHWRPDDHGSGLSDDERPQCPHCRTNARATRLHHPNIVPVLSPGRHDGVEFLASEFVRGDTLSEHLNGEPLPVLTAAEIVETLAR